MTTTTTTTTTKAAALLLASVVCVACAGTAPIGSTPASASGAASSAASSPPETSSAPAPTTPETTEPSVDPATASSSPTTEPTPEPTPRCEAEIAGEPDPAKLVPSQANIYGAGKEEPPAPAGGGGGVLPSEIDLPPGAGRIVTFEVQGCVNPIDFRPDTWTDAGGTPPGPTNTASFEGISGIVHTTKWMFLTGVFLTDDPPADPAPERLDFSEDDAFDLLDPLIAQTFYIGEGEGRRVRVPDEATRLFLGFADGYLAVGPPGWYANNRGELEVTVTVE